MSKDNNVDEDFLTEDPEISSQKIVLLSFLSPEKILAQKDIFMFGKFLDDYAVQWKTTKLEAWMAQQFQAINTKLEGIAGSLDKLDLSGAAVDVRNNLVRVDRFVEEFQQYVRKNTVEITESELKKEYEDFTSKNSTQLEEEYFKLNDFHTTIRGIKVRGVFPSEAEATIKAKRLQKSDPSFNIYMGYVGKWMAWEPDPNKVKDQEYANDELNTLMKKYRENEDARDTFYTEQKNRKVAAVKSRSVEDAESVAGVTSNTTADATVSLKAEPEGTQVETQGSPFSGGSAQYDGMFSGPADLVIQRKMQAKAADAKEADADADAKEADADADAKESV
jgi:hypothetical protein